MTTIKLHHGDCLNVLDLMEENSVDAVVTDPPYHLTSGGKGGFMGKAWDGGDIAFVPDTWRKVMRVLKPGGYLLAFAATKNYHRLVCAIEDAGFEIRDCISHLHEGPLLWVQGQGFPKSQNISIAIDKQSGKTGDRSVGFNTAGKTSGLPPIQRQELRSDHPDYEPYSPATEEAKKWEGWGTALKPAVEFICVARKPLSEGTVAANVLRWGTGAINVGATKVGNEILSAQKAGQAKLGTFERSEMVTPEREGRWPANLAHDGSDEVLEGFPKAGTGNGKGAYSYAGKEYNNKDTSMFNGDKPQAPSNYNDNGSAARFFYCAKANKHARSGSKHPTVKPIALMQWLVRMVTPPGGTILDPFAGSGTTGQAAINEGFNSLLIEREAEYVQDIKNRFEGQCEVVVEKSE